MIGHPSRPDSVAELRRLERWFEVVCQRHQRIGKLHRFFSQAGGALLTAVALVMVYFALATTFPRIPTSAQDFKVYFADCDAARAAGTAPLYRSGSGYRPALDPDGDGIACDLPRR